MIFLNVATNWKEDEVPNETSDVIIPETTNQLKITSNEIKYSSLTIQENATVTISCDFTNLGKIDNYGTLTINGNSISNNGTIVNAGILNINGTFTNNSQIGNYGTIEIGSSENNFSFTNAGTFSNHQNIFI